MTFLGEAATPANRAALARVSRTWRRGVCGGAVWLLALWTAGIAGAQETTAASPASPAAADTPAPTVDPATPGDASEPGFWGRLGGTTPIGMAPPDGDSTGIWGRTGRGIAAIWSAGHTEAFVPGYIWHTPWGYSVSQRERYNSVAWGLGLGRSAIDEKQRTRILYAIGSADSFSKPQYMVGYFWLAHTRPHDSGMHIGGGYTVAFIGRADRLSYTPLPLVLPVAGLGWHRLEVMTSYIPFLDVGLFFARIRLK